MVGTGRTNKLIRLFEGEIDKLYYEIYIGNDELKRVRTYAKLNDGFNTLLKFEELGLYTEELVNELKFNGYTKLDTMNAKILKK